MNGILSSDDSDDSYRGIGDIDPLISRRACKEPTIHQQRERNMRVDLPGGVFINNTLEKSVVLKAISGEFEMFLDELQYTSYSHPEKITEILYTGIEKIGDTKVTKDLVRQLCVEDRDYLMLQLTQVYSGKTTWLQITCSSCSERADIPIDWKELPVKNAGRYFPQKRCRVSGVRLKLKVADGFLQEALAKCSSPRQSVHIALKHCVVDVEGVHRDRYIAKITGDIMADIEKELESMKPVVTKEVTLQCPYCSSVETIQLDFLGEMLKQAETIISEVHTIAMHYNWSEAEILAMPKSRRERYLTMIETSQEKL